MSKITVTKNIPPELIVTSLRGAYVFETELPGELGSHIQISKVLADQMAITVEAMIEKLKRKDAEIADLKDRLFRARGVLGQEGPW